MTPTLSRVRSLHNYRGGSVDQSFRTPGEALAKGYLPLEVQGAYRDRWDVGSNFTSLLTQVANGTIYPNGSVPSQELQNKRIERIQHIIQTLNQVAIATYQLTSDYTLGEISEIFETLNTTGVRVSTVDLIHSLTYKETRVAGSDAFSIRDWLDELGELDGAKGWSSSSDKPERVAQLVTASYIGLADKPPARTLTGAPASERGEPKPLASIKANDLLRTPGTYWVWLAEHQDAFATQLGRFQKAVASNHFGMDKCPYPTMACVYMGIAWSRNQEEVVEDKDWQPSDLDLLFRAFFWRNALSGRYDQGFLTKSMSDMKQLRGILRMRSDHAAHGHWLSDAQAQFDSLMAADTVDEDDVYAAVIDGKTKGARRNAVRLLLWGTASRDALNLGYLHDAEPGQVELHHIFPKKWLGDNHSGDVGAFKDEAKALGQDRVNCAANLMPLSNSSNRTWSAKKPGQALTEAGVNFDSNAQAFKDVFIDRECYDLLVSDEPTAFRQFIARRGKLLTKALMAKTLVRG